MKKLVYFIGAVNCFFYDPNDPDEDWEEGYHSPLERPDVKELYSRFDMQPSNRLYINKEELKQQIILAYDCADIF